MLRFTSLVWHPHEAHTSIKGFTSFLTFLSNICKFDMLCLITNLVTMSGCSYVIRFGKGSVFDNMTWGHGAAFSVYLDLFFYCTISINYLTTCSSWALTPCACFLNTCKFPRVIFLHDLVVPVFAKKNILIS
jgi:hypothetical protein